MLLSELVGKVIIRRSRTIKGDELFYNEPCLLLALNDDKAIVCFVQDNEDYAAGDQVILSAEYMDNDWIEYGPLINSACNMRAQLVRRILEILGIHADEDSLLTLCRSITYKELYDELRGQLSLDALIFALEPTNVFDSTQSSEKEDVLDIFDDNSHGADTSWSELKQPSTPKYKGFVRRG